MFGHIKNADYDIEKCIKNVTAQSCVDYYFRNIPLDIFKD